MKLINKLKPFFENLDKYRDKVVLGLIGSWWPQIITPNHLTVARMGISAALFFLLFYLNNTNKALILSLFSVGAISDLLDGSIARGFKKETKFGAVMDPIADRMLIIPIAVYSLFSSDQWFLLFIVITEFINFLVSAYAQGKHISINPNIFGKIKMFLQSVVFGAILVFWPQSPHYFFIIILWLSLAFIIISIFIKITEAKSLLRNNAKNL